MTLNFLRSGAAKWILALVLWMVGNLSIAQEALTLDQIQSATQSTDLSMQALTGMIGDFFAHPMSSFGGPSGSGQSTLMGSMFLIFNGAFFLLCAIGGTYGLVSGIVSTAHEGEVLGRRLSAVWMPIRMVVGIAGVVPMFGGFNLAQVVMVVNAGLGIGLANLLLMGAVTATNGFQGLQSPGVGHLSGGQSFQQAGDALFYMHVCRLIKNGSDETFKNETGASRDFLTLADDIVVEPGVIRVNNKSGQNVCGGVEVHVNLPADEVRGDSMLEFRNSAVNYKNIAQAVQKGYVENLPKFSSAIYEIAKEWHQQWVNANEVKGAPEPVINRRAIELAVLAYAGSVQKKVEELNAFSQSSDGAIRSHVVARIKADGWAGLGAWGSVFAEVNAGIASAMKSVELRVIMPAQSDDEFIQKGMAAAAKSDQTEIEARGADAEKRWFCEIWKTAYTPTGNCSLGQAFVGWMTKSVVAEGSGGGDLVNPVTMMKNVGDYAMLTAETLWVLKTSIGEVKEQPEVAGPKQQSWYDRVSSKITGGVTGWIAEKVVNLAGGVYKAFVEALPLIVGLLFGLGAMMSIYIPMLPFIIWMSAFTSYCVIVFEGLAAGPIAALAHIEADGEGMGQKTERAYLFQLNLLARPPLMVIGFFAAMALSVVLGTITLKLFIPAMANAQGNSVTGVFSAIGFMFIFMVLNWTLIQAAYNMVTVIPDQVLGMIGSGHSESLGRDIEGKMTGFFLSAGKVAQGPLGGAFRLGEAKGPDSSKGKDSKDGGKRKG